MRNLNQRPLTAALLGAIILTTAPNIAYADETEVLKTRSEIAIKAEEINKQEGELSVLDNQRIDLQIQIEEYKKTAEAVTAEITQVVSKISAKENEYYDKQEVYADRLRTIYKTGNVGLIQTILQSKNFSDFLVRVRVINTVVKEDSNLLKAIQNITEELATQKSVLDNKKTDLDGLVEKLSAAGKETETSREKQAELIAKLNEEKENLSLLLVGQEDQLLDEIRVVLSDSAATEAQLKEARNLLSAISGKVTTRTAQANAADLNTKLTEQISAIQVRLEEAAKAEAERLTSPEIVDVAVEPSVTDTGASQLVQPADTSLTSPSGSAIGEAALNAAKTFLGVPYVYGGNSYSGIDCSGLTSNAYSQAGNSIPRTATAQYNASTKIARADIIPGDLLFWGYNGELTHVTMYAGNGMTIHAPSEGYTVMIVPMLNMEFIGAGRPY